MLDQQTQERDRADATNYKKTVEKTGGHGGGHSVRCMGIFDLKDHSTGATDTPTSDVRPEAEATCSCSS